MPDGSLEPVRCGASNRCSYCAMFAAIEAATVLELDSAICQPTVGLTTTTLRPDFTFDELRKAEHFLWRSLREGRTLDRGRPRREEAHSRPEPFPDLRYIGFLEWTTGKGTHSGGHRRPHIHHLVKGIPAGHELLERIVVQDERGNDVTTNRLEQRVAGLWRAFTGDAYVVDCRPLRTPVGAIRYLALHHHKREQAPPPGFTGRRLRPSKGYYEKPIAELRELARRMLKDERIRDEVEYAIGVEIEGDERERELELDASVIAALVEGLRSLARAPLELQYDLSGEVDHKAERDELVRRTVAALELIRQQNPPELVRVRERQDVDPDTGETVRRATAVLGPVERVVQPPCETRAAA